MKKAAGDDDVLSTNMVKLSVVGTDTDPLDLPPHLAEIAERDLGETPEVRAAALVELRKRILELPDKEVRVRRPFKMSRHQSFTSNSFRFPPFSLVKKGPVGGPHRRQLDPLPSRAEVRHGTCAGNHRGNEKIQERKPGLV